MAYVPDKLGEKRRTEKVSQTACEFFIKYCEHADRETGLTFANPKTCAEAFQIRIDNAQKYDKELIDKGWIRLIEHEARICRKVEAGWQPKSQRQGKAENTAILNFRNELNNILKFRKSSYILGEIPKFKENILNFRKTYKEYIDQHINQQLDQLIDHLQKDAQDAPKASKKKPIEKPNYLSPDFTVTEDLRKWVEKNAPDVDFSKSTTEFIEFWCEIATRNHRRTERGWKATWRKRMTALQEKFEEKTGNKNGTNHGNNSQYPKKPTNAEVLAKSADFYANYPKDNSG